ncbi:MAG: sigma-54 dependent transcriptional regulator [Actinobacteria bacterium]|nr:sigma-54 dependent transcriptional regulator [Actinomycetota bacterium]MCL5882383.1 sigma-54 dependent transcriptional regulator [Actinomycetota bacterium]
MPNSILIVDDEKNMRFVVGRALSGAGHEVREASSGEEALDAFDDSVPDLVILDQRMPGMGGLEALAEIKKQHPGLPVIMLTAHGNVESAVQAMKAGATEYLTKPFDVEELKLTVAKALKVGKLEREVDYLRGELDRDYDTSGIIGESPQMKQILETVARVAASEASVMIYGESGTGKELIARALHEQSSRQGKPFIQLSCAALPETLLESELFGYEKGAFTGAGDSKPGRFELADTGTLFLDEIGDISLTVQVKLLRVLEQMSFERLGSSKTINVDVRLIGATNRDLPSMIKQGQFREDLYYRLNVIPVNMPPLRERRGDISLLAKHFLTRFAPDKELADSSLRLLEAYHWPGNVRELQNTIERATILSQGKAICPEDLPAEVRMGAPLSSDAIRLPAEGVALEKVERELIAQALTRTDGNRTRAAALLGVSRHTLLYRIEKYGLEK